MFLMSSCVSPNNVVNDKIQRQKYIDAIAIVNYLMTTKISEVYIHMEENSDDYIITSPYVEKIVYDYAQTHEGGVDRCSVARALDDLMSALHKIADVDNSNSVSKEEMQSFVSRTIYNHGVEILLCLAIEYEDVPR